MFPHLRSNTGLHWAFPVAHLPLMEAVRNRIQEHPASKHMFCYGATHVWPTPHPKGHASTSTCPTACSQQGLSYSLGLDVEAVGGTCVLIVMDGGCKDHGQDFDLCETMLRRKERENTLSDKKCGVGVGVGYWGAALLSSHITRVGRTEAGLAI